MAKSPKRKPDWYLERMERNRQFRELLEKRKARDEELAAERKAREGRES